MWLSTFIKGELDDFLPSKEALIADEIFKKYETFNTF